MPGEVLLSNMYGCVTRSEEGVIVCECRGVVVTVLLLVGSVFMLGGPVTAMVLLRTQVALAGLIMPVLFGGALGLLAYRRIRAHGTFVLDHRKGSFVRGPGGDVESLSLVRGPWMIRDYTDGMSRSPRWLVVEAGGRRYRLGKGSPAELQPVVAALAAVGIASNARP